MSALEVRGVSKAYGATPVLHDVDLTVPAHGVTALLGPSGCGKTTLLRLVAGFDDPDGGEIRFGDQLVYGAGRSVPARRRRVGYVPQEGALFPHLTAGANATFGLTRRERTADRAAQLLTQVGLAAELATRYPHELSGGQQQRVALARALAPQPALVLLDEPFSSLDAGLREATRHAVLEVLHAARTTTLLVTHDQAEALSVADDVAVLRDGRVRQHAAPDELYRRPVDVDVARFVGAAVLLEAVVYDGVAASALGDVPVPDAPDGPVRLLLRPEQLRLGVADGGPTARVEQSTYYGHDCAVVLTLLPDGPRVTARVVGAAPAVGDTVGITVVGAGVAYPS